MSRLYTVYGRNCLYKCEFILKTEDEAFIVCSKKYSLIIKEKYSQAFNGNIMENYISVYLVNNPGERIDSYTVEPGDIDWKIISELHTLARRSALCIDDAINEMLTELKKDGIIGNNKKVGIYSATWGIKSGKSPLKRIFRASADEIVCFSQVDRQYEGLPKIV